MKPRFLLPALAATLLAIWPQLPRPIVAEAPPRHIEVIAKRFTYEPAEITLKKGEPVLITLKSQDVAHGIRFRELNLQAKIGKGGSGKLAFTPTETGDFVGHCSVFCGSGHGSMILTLHVIE